MTAPSDVRNYNTKSATIDQHNVWYSYPSEGPNETSLTPSSHSQSLAHRGCQFFSPTDTLTHILVSSLLLRRATQITRTRDKTSSTHARITMGTNKFAGEIIGESHVMIFVCVRVLVLGFSDQHCDCQSYTPHKYILHAFATKQIES